MILSLSRYNIAVSSKTDDDDDDDDILRTCAGHGIKTATYDRIPPTATHTHTHTHAHAHAHTNTNTDTNTNGLTNMIHICARDGIHAMSVKN
jgi:hypothetical protein